MSAHIGCVCLGSRKEKRKNWVVIERNCNYSHFERPKGCRHYSDYSQVICKKCNAIFRTKANYVSGLKDGKL